MSKSWTAALGGFCVLMAGVALAQPTLMLRQAVSLALRNDSRIKESEAKQESARRETELTRARFGPNLFTGSGAMYTSGFPQTPGGALPSIFNLAFTQTVFDLPSRGRQRAAEREAEIQKLEVASTRDLVTLETASTYLELVSVRHSLDRLRSASNSAQAIVSLEIERLREVRVLPVDLLRVRLSAAQLHQRVVSLENQESALEGQLRLLTGIARDQPLFLAAEDLPSSPNRSIDELLAMATANSVALRAVELGERAREDNLSGQRGAYWPSLDLVANYAVYSRFNNLDKFFNQFQRNSINAGIEARVPIFSAQTGPAVAVARSQLLEAQTVVKRQRDQLEIDVRQAAGQTHEADADREVAELDLAIAQEAMRLVDARAAEGRADRLDRERALVDEARAWDRFFHAEWAHQKAQLQLRRVTGELSRLFP
jgi:outer membrane protein TolC